MNRRNPIQINQRFGKLTVINKDPEKKPCGKYQVTRWICKCDCGKTVSMIQSNLKRQKSCGCSRSAWIKNRHGKTGCNWQGYEEISGAYFQSLKRGAKKRNLLFTIGIEEIWNLFLQQNRKCALTGIEISFHFRYKEKSKQQTASLDRINSSQGYTIDNIQWIHKELNLMKLDMSNSEFIEWCHKVKKYNLGNKNAS